jgi:hypothetical protein
MPKDFITDDGYGITDKCREYLYPLISGEDYPPYENGLPKYVTLNAAVAKKLAPFEICPTSSSEGPLLALRSKGPSPGRATGP